MPELPEVTNTTEGLQRVLPGLLISFIWTDLAKKEQVIKQFRGTIKEASFFKKFQSALIGKKIKRVYRRAKNILIETTDGQIILIHLKMTGHLLFGKYQFEKKDNKWIPKEGQPTALFDPFNKYIHFVISFTNGFDLVFCDARKFGKVTLFKEADKDESLHLKNLGPEPLENSFTYPLFRERLYLKPRTKIKIVLMDQSIIGGIGNIYSDEMLWLAKIHPESITENIPLSTLKLLYRQMRMILNKGIDSGGDSMSDYRNIDGEKGNFQNHHNVYQRKNKPCSRKDCPGVILRKVIGSRSSHFCNQCQKLYK